jgi:hypothetical protein
MYFISAYTFYLSSVSIRSLKLSSDYGKSGLININNIHILGLPFSDFRVGVSETDQDGNGERKTFQNHQNLLIDQT